MLDLADELGLPLNLGGGIGRATGWRTSSAASRTRELAFHTHEVVCDRAAYDRLSRDRAETDFFPAYRAPAE